MAFNKLIPLFIVFVGIGVMVLLGIKFYSSVKPVDLDNESAIRIEEYNSSVGLLSVFVVNFRYVEMGILIIMVIIALLYLKSRRII